MIRSTTAAAILKHNNNNGAFRTVSRFMFSWHGAYDMSHRAQGKAYKGQSNPTSSKRLKLARLLEFTSGFVGALAYNKRDDGNLSEQRRVIRDPALTFVTFIHLGGRFIRVT